jgi:hypothetical protein
MLHGHGFRREFDNQEKAFGFFTTRFVDADSEIQAGQQAIAALQNESKFRWMSRCLSSECVDVEEIVEVSFWTRRFSRRLGFTFYMADEDAESNAVPNGGPAAPLDNSVVT